MAILPKIFVVITIITTVYVRWIARSDKNTKQLEIILADEDKCCYNRDNLVHLVRRLGDGAKGRIKIRISYFFLLFEDMGQTAPPLAVPFVRYGKI